MDKLICLGKNYSSHAQEMGDEPLEKPVIFLKPPSVCVNVRSSGIPFPISPPWDRGSLHYECEIVLRLNAKMEIEAVTLGLDMTLRDEQSILKKKGHPWEVSKVFKDSAVVGPWINLTDFPGYLDEEFTLSLNHVVRQRGYGKDMLYSPAKCIEYVQTLFPLSAGDLIYTGTPAGVGPVSPGMVAELTWGTLLKYQVLFNRAQTSAQERV